MELNPVRGRPLNFDLNNLIMIASSASTKDLISSNLRPFNIFTLFTLALSIDIMT